MFKSMVALLRRLHLSGDDLFIDETPVQCRKTS